MQQKASPRLLRLKAIAVFVSAALCLLLAWHLPAVHGRPEPDPRPSPRPDPGPDPDPDPIAEAFAEADPAPLVIPLGGSVSEGVHDNGGDTSSPGASPGATPAPAQGNEYEDPSQHQEQVFIDLLHDTSDVVEADLPLFNESDASQASAAAAFAAADAGPPLVNDPRVCTDDELGNQIDIGSLGNLGNLEAGDQALHIANKPGVAIAEEATSAGVSVKDAPTASLSDPVRDRVNLIMQQFENLVKPGLGDYAFCTNVGDGRGFTAGIGQFTTRDGDALNVLVTYRTKFRRNDLAMYEPALQAIKGAFSPDVLSIPKFCCAWKQTNNHSDPDARVAFHQAQNIVYDQFYYAPAMAIADQLGAVAASNLVRAHLIDTVSTQGLGDDPDSIYGVLRRAQATLGKTPAPTDPTTTVDWAFLATIAADKFHAAFSDARAYSMAYPLQLNPDRDSPPAQQPAGGAGADTAQQLIDPSTAPSGPAPDSIPGGAGATRPQCFKQFAAAGQWDLLGSLTCQTSEFNFTIPVASS